MLHWRSVHKKWGGGGGWWLLIVLIILVPQGEFSMLKEANNVLSNDITRYKHKDYSYGDYEG